MANTYRYREMSGTRDPGRKDKRFAVGFTPHELAALKAYAKAKDISVSGAVRLLALRALREAATTRTP